MVASADAGASQIGEIDTVGYEVHLLDGSSNPLITSRIMNFEQQMTCRRLIREPPLDRVDRGGHARRYVATVAAALGGVDRGHERHAEQPGERVACPRDEPVVGVHDVGRQPSSRAASWVI